MLDLLHKIVKELNGTVHELLMRTRKMQRWFTVSACETDKWILDVAYVHDKTVMLMPFCCFLFQANTFFKAISESLTKMKSSVMNLRRSLEDMKINNSGLYRSG